MSKTSSPARSRAPAQRTTVQPLARGEVAALLPGQAQFARDDGKVELRGLAPAELAQALDALACAEGTDRNAYVVAILEAHVKSECHKAMVRYRMLKGNPLMMEAGGGQGVGA